MAKAIKHIQAGLLHIEVLGSVPERVKKRRSARAGPTPPAQRFYNLKHSWQELELTIAANFQGHDLVLTSCRASPSNRVKARSGRSRRCCTWWTIQAGRCRPLALHSWHSWWSRRSTSARSAFHSGQW